MVLYLGILLFFLIFYTMKEPFVVSLDTKNISLEKFTVPIKRYCSSFIPYKHYYRKLNRYFKKS
jgi:hypothetical protein